MLALAPLAPRVHLHVVPLATLALVAAIAGCGAWTLCAGDGAFVWSEWGYRRGAQWMQALSALFLHADAPHLLGNLVLLGLSGACLEQAWGGARTVVLFLAAGALAIAFDAAFVEGDATIVGASAGVSALLGACFVRFRRRRVRVAYVYLDFARPRAGSFAIPCAALGVVFAAQQAVGATWNACTGDQSVAFLSHAAGTAAGALVALADERRRLRQKQRS